MSKEVVTFNTKVTELEKLRTVERLTYAKNLVLGYSPDMNSKAELIMLNEIVSAVEDIEYSLNNSKMLRYADNAEVADLHYSTEAVVLSELNNLVYFLKFATPLKVFYDEDIEKGSSFEEKLEQNKENYKVVYEDLETALRNTENREHSLFDDMMSFGHYADARFESRNSVILSELKSKQKGLDFYKDLKSNYNKAVVEGFLNLGTESVPSFAYIDVIPDMFKTLSDIAKTFKGLDSKLEGANKHAMYPTNEIISTISFLLHKFDSQLDDLLYYSENTEISKEEKKLIGDLLILRLKLFAEDESKRPTSYHYKYLLEESFMGTATSISDKLEELNSFFKSNGLNAVVLNSLGQTLTPKQQSYAMLNSVLESYVTLKTIDSDDDLAMVLKHTLVEFLTSKPQLLVPKDAGEVFVNFVYRIYSSILDDVK